ncbi:MAG: glycosyltransferase [Gemmatimonadaceae bacterium]
MTGKRPVVLFMVGRYIPGFRAGGPVRSAKNLVEALGAEFDFRVVAFDRDLGQSTPYPGLGGSWTRVGPADVLYVAPRGATRALASLLRAGGYDLLYLNSFFDPRFALLPLILRRLRLVPDAPVVIAPRGQFAVDAMQIRAWRKRVYLTLVRHFLLRGDEHWQATGTPEASAIQSTIHPRATQLRVAENVPPLLPPLPPRVPKVPGVLRAVFLSRVAPMKNLLGAIQMLRGLRGTVSLDVVGPLEDLHYWAECQTASQAGEARLALRALAPVQPSEVPQTFARYDLFVFPTHGENFGHVIIESLLAGCPVLTSDRTPWRGLADRRAGWDFPLEKQDVFIETLQWAVDADDAAYAPYSAGARAFAERYIREDRSVDKTREMFEAAMDGS